MTYTHVCVCNVHKSGHQGGQVSIKFDQYLAAVESLVNSGKMDWQRILYNGMSSPVLMISSSLLPVEGAAHLMHYYCTFTYVHFCWTSTLWLLFLLVMCLLACFTWTSSSHLSLSQLWWQRNLRAREPKEEHNLDILFCKAGPCDQIHGMDK